MGWQDSTRRTPHTRFDRRCRRIGQQDTGRTAFCCSLGRSGMFRCCTAHSCSSPACVGTALGRTTRRHPPETGQRCRRRTAHTPSDPYSPHTSLRDSRRKQLSRRPSRDTDEEVRVAVEKTKAECAEELERALALAKEECLRARAQDKAEHDAEREASLARQAEEFRRRRHISTGLTI